MNREKENIDDVFFDSLENFELAPSQELKKRIMKDMFFVNLVRYHLYKLIGGIAGVSVIALISIYLFNISGQPFIEDISKTNKQNTEVNTIKNNAVTIAEINTNKINTIPDKIISNNSISQNNETVNTQKQEPTIQKNNSIIKNTDNKQTVEKAVIKANLNQNILKNNQAINNSTTQLNSENKNQFSDPLNNQSNIINKNSSLMVQDKIIAHSDDNSVADKNTSSDFGSSDNLNFKNANSEYNITEKINHLIAKNSILPFDLEDRDIFNDTTLVNFKGEAVVFKSKFFAIDAFWSGYIHQSIFSNPNLETENFSLQRSDAVKPVNGYECFGINFNKNKKHLLVQAGISLTKITDEFNYASLLLNPKQKFVLAQNNNPFNFTDNGNYFLIDTPGGYWHYTYVSDSIIHVSDSIWVHIKDTNLVNIYDSTLKTVYDTLKNKKLRNSYSYFEIPVMVGYETTYGNFDIALKGGIITSFLINTTGENINYYTGELNPISANLPFRKILFSGIISVSANYKITDHWGIYVEPYYRQSLTSMLKNNSMLNQRVNAYGARFGVRYKF